MSPMIIWSIAIAVSIVAVAILLKKKLPIGPPVPAMLAVGNPLPEFSAVHEDGSKVSSSQLRGKPTVILFVRGNWCPFCTKQVEEITSHYKDLTDQGARLIFITPRPLDTTRRVAEFFKVDFEFWLDESLAIAKSLGLILSDGVPKALGKEYGNDTFWPTALIIDKDGIIRFSRLSRLVFDRPNSEALVKELKKL